MSEPILTATNLNVDLNGNHILENLNFTVNPGDTMAIIGPNGAGKTILFRALIGLIPYTGNITWAANTKIGYVPQRLYVGSDLPLNTCEFFGLKDANIHEVHRTLSAVGFKSDDINPLLKQKLGNLSGGQLQRVLIAWALIGHPNILLFDEPTTGVDISAEESIYALLHRLQDQEHLTLLLISHELQVVYRYATNVLCLNKEGICFGPPKKALTETTLSQLFGENTSIYHHQHHP